MKSVTLLYLGFGVALCQTPPFSARFERVISEGSKADTVRGRVYFVAPWRVYYNVDYPRSQHISVVWNVMTIYYPDEKSACVIKSNTETETAVSQGSLSTNNTSEMMERIGFRRSETFLRHDTSYSIWKPKDPRAAPFAHVTFGGYAGRSVLTEVVRKDGTPLMRTYLSGHIRLDTLQFPTKYMTERFSRNGEVTVEKMSYADVNTSRTFLDSLSLFAVPAGTRTRVLDW